MGFLRLVGLFILLCFGLASRSIQAQGPPGRTGEQQIKPDTAPRLTIAVYDIRDLMVKPTVLGLSGRAFHSADPALKAARLIEAALSRLDALSEGHTRPERETMVISNGTHLEVRTDAARHAHLAALLQTLRRVGDVAVAVHTRLYEVDDAFYTKLKAVKPLSLGEAERRFIQGLPSKEDSLFKLLEKQTRIMEGNKVKVNSGEEAVLLSRHQVVRCLPSPERLRKGEKGSQTILDGVAFMAGVQVSDDRRSVRVRLVEKAAVLQQTQKVQITLDTGKDADAEVPLVKEMTQSQTVAIPDGGSLLVAVNYRPRALVEQKRWLVLCITPRIIIMEEERAIGEN